MTRLSRPSLAAAWSSTSPWPMTAWRGAFSMRGDRWKRAYVYEVGATAVRLRHDGAVVDTLLLDALEQVALRFDASLGLWQWLLVLRDDDVVRALPHDDSIAGHALLATTLRALPGFAHRAYAEALTSPSRRIADSRAQLLWTRGDAKA